jgi:hypothetical protein
VTAAAVPGASTAAATMSPTSQRTLMHVNDPGSRPIRNPKRSSRHPRVIDLTLTRGNVLP